MNKDNLVDQCCEVYGMKLPEFANKYDLSESTLKQWRTNIPSYGKLLMEKMIEIHQLHKDVEKLDRIKSILKS